MGFGALGLRRGSGFSAFGGLGFGSFKAGI